MPGRSLLVALLVSAAAFSGCGRERPTYSAVLVTLDTTRADALGCYGNRVPGVSSALDALARRAVVFENAHTVAPLTLPAHASILTGLDPPRHGIRNNGAWLLPASARTLAEGAKERGFQTAAFVSAVVLDRTFGLDQGFDTYSGPARRDNLAQYEVASRRAPEVVDEALRWLDGREHARPFFLWLHLFDPHQPYDPPPELVDAKVGRDPYLAEIACVDRELARLFAALEREGLLASTAIVVVADHGESLGQFGESTHGALCYEPTLHVPWLLVRPDGRRAGERSRAPVSVVDVAPTLAEAMGVTLPADLDGTSLWDGDPPAGRGVYFESYLGYLEYGASPLAGWLDERGKYLHSSEPEFHVLAQDPDERTNAADPAVIERYRSALAAALARAPLRAEESAPDEGLRAQIRALGYAGGASREALPHPLEPSSRPSPRALIAVSEELARATGLVDAGRHAEALDIVRGLPRQQGEMTRALAIEATCLLALGRNVEAVGPLQRYLALAPGRPDEYYNLGVCLKDAGRMEEAIASFRRALELEPGSPPWLASVVAYLRRAGREAEAAEFERRYRDR